jgi:hypothetical protein
MRRSEQFTARARDTGRRLEPSQVKQVLDSFDPEWEVEEIVTHASQIFHNCACAAAEPDPGESLAMVLSAASEAVQGALRADQP